VLLDGVEFRPLKLSQILCVAMQDLKRKVDLLEMVIQEVQDEPKKVGIESKLSLFDSFNDLSFFFAVAGHREFIGRASEKIRY